MERKEGLPLTGTGVISPREIWEWHLVGKVRRERFRAYEEAEDGRKR